MGYLFHRIAYVNYCADWDDLHDHLRDVPWGVSLNVVLLLLLVNIVSGFRLELMYIQASTYEKQGHATMACLISKFGGYRRVKSCTPPTK